MNKLRRSSAWLLILALAMNPIGCLFSSDDDDSDSTNGDGDDNGSANILYVDIDNGSSGNGSSWATAYTNLRTALAAAGASGEAAEIWVAEGTYTSVARSDSTAAFDMVDHVELYGEFAGNETARDERDWSVHETTLSGSGHRSVIAADLTNGGTLDGFTITGGGTDRTAFGGGASFQVSTFVTPPTVRNCRFVGNSAEEFGGGLYVNRGTTVVNCVFIDNEAGTGAGLFMHGYTDDLMVVANCAFYGNGESADLSGGGGLSVWSNGETIIVNCILSGNEADFGGGMSIVGDATIANCTFTGNHTRLSNGVAGLRTSSSNATVANCVFWDNTNYEGSTEVAQLSGELSSTLDVRFCTIDSLETYVGNNNIDSDPLFVDADGADDTVGTEDDDLHLAGGSTSHNSGSHQLVPRDAIDLDGDGDTAEKTPVNLDGDSRSDGTTSRGAY